MSSTASSSYDEIPYEGFVLFQTHPDHLAALARLFEFSPPEVETCRVLELGCARGDNLIPMAVSLPRARLVGIDFSRRQIDEGRATIAALGLTNIELLELNITNLNNDFGQFDFILAHGVFSWTDNRVQEALLKLCADRLAPNGLAYVSYNTYPGWHMGSMVRDMMLYHSRNASGAQERIRSSRGLLATLGRLLARYDNPYARGLCEEAELIQPRPDSYLYHEYLGESNQPVYFHQFLKRAASHDLQYLAEAQFRNMAVAQSPELFRDLDAFEVNWAAREQYYDFIKGQSFRQSVLCHANIACSRAPSVSEVMSLRITGNVRPAAVDQGPHTCKNVAADFKSFAGQTVLSTSEPLVKTLLRVLWEAWPASLPFATLLARFESAFTSENGGSSGVARVTDRQLAESLIRCLAKGLINLHVLAPAFTTEISEFPRASPFARRQAIAASRVANLRQQVIELNDFDRLVLAYLDGRHDRRALAAELEAHVENGALVVQGQPVTIVQDAETLLATAIEESLRRIAAGALLI
jgi:methyltransferase-like protein/predicted O-methyltransferase YrrM